MNSAFDDMPTPWAASKELSKEEIATPETASAAGGVNETRVRGTWLLRSGGVIALRPLPAKEENSE